MRVLRIGAGITVILAVTAIIGFFWFFTSAVPDYSGTLTLEGLTAPVEVRTDDHGIPHIYAENESDLYFAQGYIIARERLFQMDTTRRAGRGELSTLFGEATLEKDRFLKTVGFYRQSVRSYPHLLPETKKALQSFARGVNAYIDTADPLPREYFFLGATPDHWKPEDSLVVALMMSYSLTRSKKIDLVMHNIRVQAGDDVVRQIIPSYPEFAPTLSGKRVSTAAVQQATPFGHSRSAPESGKTIDFFNSFPFSLDIAASNWMIFSGRKTDTGQAMFAGSPDLKPTLPALFYLMHLKAGDIDAMGGVLPGVPGLGPLGYNGHLAFSAVNGRGDELDYFIERINPQDSNQYLTEEGYKEFRTVDEEIRIKTGDGFRTETLTVRISRHGPIISGVLPGVPENCAMQWAALEMPNRDIDGLIKILKADSFDAFRDALSYIRTINLNIGYADKDGNIGWQFTAAPPIRKKGSGTLPVPGWTGEYDWLGIVPFEQVPYELNPERGYVASFNNEPGNASHHLTNYYLFERAIRFQELMASRGDQPVSFAELKEMQLDTVSVVAERWVPEVLRVCAGDKALAPCQQLFQNWDFRIDKQSSAATLFNYFYYLMMGNTLKDDVGESIWNEELGRMYLYYVPDLVLTRIINIPDHPFYDDLKTADTFETRDDIIRKSIAEAIQYLTGRLGENTEAWRWGDVHKMPFDHPLGSRLTFLNLTPIPTHGSHHTINSGFWDSSKPFEMSSGGVIRMMVDFSDLSRSTIISPPGQSGHFLSSYYDDLAEPWADGDQVPMQYLSGRQLPQRLEMTPP